MSFNLTTSSPESGEATVRKALRFCVALILIAALLPVFSVNCVLALLWFKAPLKRLTWIDISAQPVRLYCWQAGLFKRSAAILNVLGGTIRLVGNPLVRDGVSIPVIRRFHSPCSRPGLFDSLWLYSLTGLSVKAPLALLQQQRDQSVFVDTCLVIKVMLCLCLYRKSAPMPSHSKLFGIPFSNTRMQTAVDWIVQGAQQQPLQSACRAAYYINVNSVNLSAANARLYQALQSSDRNFIDGSGMRIAARQAGMGLADNNNGTDMLPALCEAAVERKRSVFLLGAQPGVAEQAASNLRQQYPGLHIAGVHHGYFDDDEQVCNTINQSGADIVLVALGSPRQEIWIDNNKHKLQAQCALAVGGLFDFFSGNIARAPMWMRELGLEWIWRLIQEPRAKFNRYVLGNPIFLFRVYVLQQALRGF
ncbi:MULTISPECIES: WecB/TagA/CpsF family glycosyltransferase [unclassified Pseudoalteromonas]|uniref:WecB/TagA/CpsF family glycosyltransferase n=1 Tax=unclassified Pseudoalteromonas TaxID=194690 RepID=UPI002097F791|nr:WecB/TagA/CpsF family glycosyltransferase [Pseudoalteromonas sp. XMcav2-N]MCO7189165.1 WecB/TagA/CpsF family glycosyltransferase [Pseudoalteromonas sp. XMcav2-N]